MIDKGYEVRSTAVLWKSLSYVGVLIACVHTSHVVQTYALPP